MRPRARNKELNVLGEGGKLGWRALHHKAIIRCEQGNVLIGWPNLQMP
jgi:hypothetical protein